MIYFEERDSRTWTSNATKDVGPGTYNNSVVGAKECHNHGAVPFGVCGERFKSELAMKFEALPGPGHYKEFQIPKKKQSVSYISSTSRQSNARSRPSMFKPDIDELSIASTVDNSKLRLFSSDRASKNNEKGKSKKFTRTRNKSTLSHSKTVNSIPFKRDNDNINSVGPGYYEPNVSAIHKKAPFTKIMKNTLLNKQGNMNYVQRIVKTVSKPKKATIHEKISTHKLNNQNAVFASRTARSPQVNQTPGPGMYETGYDHAYIKNNPEGFGSTTERQYLINRNVIKSPFSDPTCVTNPGVGTYDKKSRLKKEPSKSKSKKMQENLNQNRATILANAKILNKGGTINEPQKSKVDPPGPGQYDCGFNEELKILDHKLSARYRKVPFGTSSNRFKLKEYEDNIKKNREIAKRNADMSSTSDMNESLLQIKKQRNKMVNERMKEIDESRPSHMFKSQTTRLENDHKSHYQTQRKFEAEVYHNNVLITEGNRREKRENNNYVLLKKPVEYAGQKVGFDVLSPRFGRSTNSFAPGPGEYTRNELDSRENSKRPVGNPKILGDVPRLEGVKSLGHLDTPHCYEGHSTMVKKSFNKLLAARDLT
ncbi:unnamed protein product [Moneuplotes crassus]|uniref:Uncharacterized protein n=1 Tax=Euplotes crassus TaxID=5936 RepID=A0AAD1U5E0_EUPCR|nr:unnamed protein product [Moneuplotes crassus]